MATQDFHDDAYDEGYDSDEQPGVETKITFKDAFYGRQEELQELISIYETTTLQKNSKSNAPKNNNHNASNKIYSNIKKSNQIETNQTTNSDTTTPVIMVSGYSGAGKSALVDRFVKQVQSTSRNCYFLKGKYDELQCGDPFSAIVEAFSGFAIQLANGDPVELKNVQKLILNAIGSEGKVLTDVVPALKQVLAPDKADNKHNASATTKVVVPGKDNNNSFGDNSNNNNNGKNRNNGTSTSATPHMWNRLMYIFQQFVTAICTYQDRPVILFLDDLQWADTASLDLLTALLSDKSLLHHLVFVGAVRSNEVNDTHPVTTKFLNVISQHRPIHNMELLNLSMDEINTFIADTLELEPDDTTSLTKVVYDKTRGNMFFTMQALEELNRKQVIYFSRISFCWEWNLQNNLDIIQGLSDNVVDAVATKIQSAPKPLQTALTIAAYTRNIFDIGTLHHLLQAEGNPMEMKQLVKVLDTAVLEGLLSNSVGSNNYRFAHDRVQQAAYSLIAAGTDRDELRVRIGKHLLYRGKNHPDESEDWMWFVAADYLNSSRAKPLTSLELTELNLNCGEKAMGVAAFQPASKYLRKGLKTILDIDSHWTTHYQLSLRLFRAATDVELSLGNFEIGKVIGQEVLDNAQTLQDTLPTYLTLAVSLGRQERYLDALELTRTALELLSAYPKRFHLVHLMRDFSFVNKFLKSHSDNDILMLPKLEDPTKLATLGFLIECGVEAFHCGKMVVTMLCILRQLKLCFRYGLCGKSAQSFAAYGLILCGSFGDQEGGIRLGRLARQALHQTGDKHMESLVLCTICNFIDGWHVPPTEVLEMFRRAHLAGMECGDLENGFRNWVGSNYHAFISGYPLVPIERMGSELVEQLQKYGMESLLIFFLEMRLPVRHLVGSAGELDWMKLENSVPGVKDNPYGLLYACLGRMQLATFFGEYEFADRMCEKLSTVCSTDAAYTSVSMRIFYSGIIYSCLYRKTGKSKYKNRSKKYAQEMKKLTRTRGLNNFHRHLLMDAELFTFSERNMDECKIRYDQAIEASMKSGCVQDAALGSELAAEYFLQVHKDTAKGTFYYTQAYELYNEWGALAKVEDLQKKKGEYIDSTLIVDNNENGERSVASSSAGVGNSGTSQTVAGTPQSKRWISGGISVDRQPIDLDVLSMNTPRTELPTHNNNGNERKVDRDEMSCLTVPSEFNNTVTAGTSSVNGL